MGSVMFRVSALGDVEAVKSLLLLSFTGRVRELDLLLAGIKFEVVRSRVLWTRKSDSGVMAEIWMTVRFPGSPVTLVSSWCTFLCLVV